MSASVPPEMDANEDDEGGEPHETTLLVDNESYVSLGDTPASSQ